MSRKRIALLGVSLGTLINLGATGFQGTGGTALADDGAQGAKPARQSAAPSLPEGSWTRVELADSSGEGGESGEAGEAGHDGPGPLAELAPEARIAIGLMMMRAHLQAALTLMQAEPEAAGSPHLHHPLAEIFPQISADLAPETARQLRTILEAPGEALGGSDPRNRSLALAGDALSGMTALLEDSRWWEDATPGDIHRAIQILVAIAAEEYGEGVAEGKITNEEEYQDAIGLIAEARRVFAARRELLAAKDPVAAESLKAIFAELPAENFVIPDRVAVAPNAVLGALSRIELLAGRFR